MSQVELDTEQTDKLLGASVYDRIADALMQGRLQPDDRVKIRDLAQRLGTSVTPIRDAILRLVQDGALEMRSPRDIRVSRLSKSDYLETRELRIHLEGVAAAAAAKLARPDDIDRLNNIIQLNEAALDAKDFLEATRLNQAFHFEYCRLANKPILLDLLRRLWLKSGPYITKHYHAGGRDMVEHHYPLIDAFIRADSEAARLAVQTDILLGSRSIVDAFDEK